MNNNFEVLEKNIDYSFQNKALIIQAMTHSSNANERKINKTEDYERLEYLGDAVLELITSEYLYKKFPNKDEGFLTRTRASYVCEYTLSSCARELGYGDFVLLSKGERMTGGANRNSILCDLFEAVLGAIYLDGGMKPATKYVYDFLLKDIDKKSLFYDAKTNLQELIQKRNSGVLSYKIIDEEGPEHDRVYTTEVYIDDKAIARGRGQSHKASEQMAAYEALLTLKDE